MPGGRLTVQQTGRKSGVLGGKGERAVYVGVFGKHPGWDDHIDDIGLETDRLAAVKRVLYIEGVAGNIDAGSWEKLDDSQRLGGFGHEFVWRSAGGADIVVGRMWSSRDGKGRTKYPMAVVAQCVNIPPAVIEAEIMPRLEEVERRCVATTSQAEVRAAVDAARDALRSAIAGAPAGEYSEVATRQELVSMGQNPAWGEGRVGLHRVMYEVEREMAAFRPVRESGKRSTRVADTRGQHLRAPACSASTFASFRLWMAMLQALQVDAGAPVLLFRAHGMPWIDLIVGEPQGQQLFCVKASEKGLALASDVPYTMEPAFTDRCEATIKSWSGEAPAPVAQNTAAPAAPAEEATTGDEPKAKKGGLFKWGFFGLVIAAGAVAAVYFTSQGKSGPDSKLASSETSGSRASDPKPGQKNLFDKEKSKASDKQTPAGEDRAANPDAGTTKTPDANKTADDQKRLAKEAEDRRIAEEAKKQKNAADAAEKQRIADAAEKQRIADAAEKQRLASEAEGKRLADEAEKKRLADAAAAKLNAAEEEKKRLAREGAEKAASELAAKRAELQKLAGEISVMMTAGFTPDEKPSAGATLRERVGQLLNDPRLGELKDAVPESEAIRVRFTTLDSISKATEASVLLTHVSGAKLAEAMSAWERLGSRDARWGARPDADGAASAMKSLTGKVGEVSDKARGADLAKRIAEAAPRVYAGLYRASVGTDAMAKAIAAMAAFGVSADALTGADRANLAIYEYKRDVAAMGEIRPTDRAKVEAFSKRTGEFLAVAGDAGKSFAGPLNDLTKAMAAAASATDFSRSGPGAKGWKATVGASGGSVTYAWPPEGQAKWTLEFVAIAGAGATTTFVSTTEVPVGMVIDTIDAIGKWGEFMTLLPPASSGTDSRQGPRVWSYQGTGTAARIQVAPSEGQGDGWFAQGSAPAGFTAPPPVPTSPMQHITAGGAVYVSKVLGCRLPTPGEWKAAAANAGPANRRDASWGKLHALIVETTTKDKGFKPMWPDAGAFVPAGLPSRPPSARGAVPAVDSDDGVAWFAPVDQGGPGFKHLIGNVAEFTLETPSRLDGADFSAEEAKGLIGKGESLRIVGGSALSAREVDPMTPGSLDRLSAGLGGAFADVGFRLAFSAAVGAVSQTADPRTVVGAIKYLAVQE